MEKKIFEPCELEVNTFADVITTSANPYGDMQGTYDTSGNWVTFNGEEV